jgi:hypothetical protein
MTAATAAECALASGVALEAIDMASACVADDWQGEEAEFKSWSEAVQGGSVTAALMILVVTIIVIVIVGGGSSSSSSEWRLHVITSCVVMNFEC